MDVRRQLLLPQLQLQPLAPQAGVAEAGQLAQTATKPGRATITIIAE